MTTREISVDVSHLSAVPISFDDTGQGQPFLLLHGGAGPRSVRGFAALLVASGRRAIVPTHPGFDGTVRPEALRTIAGLATAYCRLLEAAGLEDVTVVGNSIGGWIAAEMALAGSSRIGRVVIADGVGVEVPEHPPTDVSGLNLPQIVQLSYHNPEPFRIDPAALPAEAQAVLAGNRAALALYAGGGSGVDPSLGPRLAAVSIPALVIWGDSDRIVVPDYGRPWAAAIPGARFELMADTGHLPQLESPDAFLRVLLGWVGPVAGFASRPSSR
jgi:pimeloyl-ACP methyl ester carboxylesterase